jgi:hypothetical protein
MGLPPMPSGGLLTYALGMPAHNRERKEQLSDEERKLHVSSLYQQGDALSKLIPSLSGDRREQAMKSLTSIEADIASIYHPNNNPGALQKDWDFLRGMFNRKKAAPALSNVSYDATVTPDLNLTAEAQFPAGGAANATSTGAPITIPGHVADVRPAAAIMTPQQRRTYTRQDEARKKAQIDVQAAGLSPQELEQEKQREDEASRAWQLDWAKRHGITGAALDELTEHIAGLPTIKSKLKPLAGSKPYRGSDGRYYQSMQDTETGVIEAMAMPEGYTPPPLAAGPIRAWKKNASGQIVSFLLDRQTNAPIPGSENPDILPPPYLTLRISQGNYHYVDEDNQVHEIPETRSSGPALGGAGGGPVSSGNTATPGTRGGRGSSGAQPAATGDRIIGTKGSAPLNKARSSYGDAVKIANLADDMVTDPSSEKDTLFVLALIRSEAGRVNAQEIASLFQAGGIAEGPERWAAKTGHGELSDDLRAQLQNFTHAQVKSSQAAVDALRSTPGDLKKKAKANMDAGASDDEFLQKVK